MKRICCLISIIISSQIVYAQNGKITGKVISVSSGESLSGATLLLVEKAKIKAADQNGTFSFSKLEVGKYTIKCSYTGFQDKTIEEIIVKDNENTDITISLDTKLEGSVIVTSKKIKAAGETVASLLIAQKNSANVSDGITAESIKKTPDKSSSDVIKRVSGASIQDDKFAIIRGLNDRYNAAFINGAPLPSTESDRKAFAFDIFPSAILDNLIIFKTATPDKTGEFAGGIIDITTKSAVPKNFTSITIGQGYNSLITGQQQYFSEAKGKNDWLGLDDGTRGIPNGVPSTKELQQILSFDDKLRIAKYYENYKWGIKHTNTRPNFNFQIAKGFNIERKEKEFLSALFSLNYNRSYSLTEGERNGFDPQPSSDSSQTPTQRAKYIDSTYKEEIVWAALGNIAIKINNRNNISWKNNFSVNTDNKLLRRIGNLDFDGQPLDFIKADARSYTSNKIFSSQFVGEHQVGSKKTKINWLAAFTEVDRKIPNIGVTKYGGTYPNVNDIGPLPTSAGQTNFNAQGSMFSTSSKESIKNIKLDITQPYTFLKNTQNFIKIGVGHQVRKRDFISRNLGLVAYAGPGAYQFDNSILNLPADQIFLGQYLGILANGKAGYTISENTESNSFYNASSTTSHAYIMSDQRFFKKFRLIYGLRVEQFNQKLNAQKTASGFPVNLDSTVTDYLPSINFVYSPTAKTNIRLSYSETVNRPEYRELAPFLFRDFAIGYNVSGDPDLKRAKIKNFDFRYEVYPGKSQLFSLSSFYKKFENPIELIIDPDQDDEIYYHNSKSGYVYGFEAEFRVLLSTLFFIKNDNALLSKFTLTGNAAIMKSEVDATGIVFDPTYIYKFGPPRTLQGQSPYIINGSLGYNDDKTGLSSTLSVNRIGDRLMIGGSYNAANIYEKARTVVDFQIAKSFLKNKIELKFNARDILAQNIVTYFDFQKSASYKEDTADRIWASFKAPKVFSFTATIKL